MPMEKHISRLQRRQGIHMMIMPVGGVNKPITGSQQAITAIMGNSSTI